MKNIKNVDDALAILNFDRAEAQDGRGGIQKYFSNRVYKATECGAWAVFVRSPATHVEGLSLGSTVEGSDRSIQHNTLWFPFTSAEFWQALERIETWCDIEWKRVNEGVETDLEPQDWESWMSSAEWPAIDFGDAT